MAVVLLVLGLAGCGGSDDEGRRSTSETALAAAVSLQDAMDSSARAIEDVRGAPDELEDLRASLEPALAQTADVIAVLTEAPDRGSDERRLIDAALEQRAFLQLAIDATRARTRQAANSSLSQARDAGTRASRAYSLVARTVGGVRELVPAETMFATARLSEAMRRVLRGAPERREGGESTTRSASTACGEGLSVNATTPCQIARDVRDTYERSGGAEVIDVFDPATGATYSMSCSGTDPTVCRGGIGAVVTIR